MMTRSIVGRFLILAVLLVSLGVIAQAALIITRGSGKVVAKANAAPAPAPVRAADAGSSAVTPAPAPEAAPIRVVYPGPLGDSPIQPRKFAAAAPVSPAAAEPAAAVQPPSAAQPVAAAAPSATPMPVAAAAVPTPVEPAPAPAPAAPAPVAVASAEAQPTADPAPAGHGGVNLNSASVDVLNHLGGGHIGQTIVKHRPYGSVEDLVRKRVVRRSVYDQIKDQVAAQ